MPRYFKRFPAFLSPRVRDRDSAYGDAFRDCLGPMGIEEVLTAPRSPWQNPHVERLIGTIRRECLDHVIVFNEARLKGVLAGSSTITTRQRRTGRWTQTRRVRAWPGPRRGDVVALPQVGALHHRHTRAA